MKFLQSAIGSIASAAPEEFAPYAEKVLALMKTFMVRTNDADLRARARATELAGIVAMIAGRERMEPILPPLIQAAISVLLLSYLLINVSIWVTIYLLWVGVKN